MAVDRDFVLRALSGLVACPSVNPTFADARSGPPGEAAVADVMSGLMRELGMRVSAYEPVPGRTSVVGRLPGAGGGRSLMLNGHLDTVGPGAMADPFIPTVRGGRLYGRGSYDMKGGLAACLGAVKAMVDNGRPLRGDLLLSAVADEEDASLGMADIATRYQVDGAVVAEPTELRLCLAHKGFSWIRVTTTGFACHGSRHERGVDANLHMGRVLARLDKLASELKSRPGHRLVGPPSVHAPLLSGGSGPSVYSPICTLQIERRTVPGETEGGVLEEVNAILRELQREDAGFVGRAETVLHREPMEAAAGSAVADAAKEAMRRVAGHEPEVIGVPYWTDAALLASAGVDVIVFGAGGMGAHEDVEFADLESTFALGACLAEVADAYCG